MKRILFLTVCLFIVNFCAWGDTVTKVYLSHNGKITQYLWNGWNTVIDDAEVGDTIFLTKGTFTGDITIDKPVTIIGAGVGDADDFWKQYCISERGTYLNGNMNIQIPDSVTIEASLLENVRINNIYVNKPIAGLKLLRCAIDGEFKANTYTVNATFINCHTPNFHCQYLDSPYIYNCSFDNFDGDSSDLANTFNILNTAIQVYHNVYNYVFVNSIFCGYHYNSTGSYNTFDHCICAEINSTKNEYYNCYQYGLGKDLSAEEILSNGWLGVDGTATGWLGGYYPFTFKPSQPYVSESSLSVSEDAKTLNVTLKVSIEQ